MAVTKRFSPWALKLHTKTAQAGAAVHIDGLSGPPSISSGLVTGLEASAGAVYATHAALMGGAPTMRFRALDLKALLDECGLEGMLVDTDGSHPGVVVFLQKHVLGGTRMALDGSEHVSITFGQGMLALRGLVLPHQGNAEIDAELIALSADGLTAPMAFSETADLDTAYPAQSVVWTLGKVKLNSETLAGVQSVQVDFGVGITAESADGNLYPTFASIQAIRPTVTLMMRHVDITSVLTEAGAYYTATQCVIYARKRAEGGTFVADVTAEHVKLTLGKCRADWVSIDGDPSMIALRLTPYYTAGSEPVYPIAINTASAIT